MTAIVKITPSAVPAQAVHTLLVLLLVPPFTLDVVEVEMRNLKESLARLG